MQTAVKCSRHLQNTPPARPPTLVGQPHWLHSRAGCSYAALHMTTHWYTRGKRGVVESSPAAIVLPSHTHVSYLQANEGIEFKEGTKFNLCERNICTGQFDENSACEQECSPCSMYSGIHHTALHCIERLTKQDLPTPYPCYDPSASQYIRNVHLLLLKELFSKVFQRPQKTMPALRPTIRNVDDHHRAAELARYVSILAQRVP